jgi:hypothetical protein
VAGTGAQETLNPYTQSPAANNRFLASTLTRYGTVKNAIVEVRHLREMGPDGHAWWSYIEGRLAALIVENL